MFFKLLSRSSVRKGSIPINKTLMFLVGALITAGVLGVILSALWNVEGAGRCTGPLKYLFSSMADMTGVSPCS